MKDLSKYITELRQQPEVWLKIAPLVEHITFLEAELRLAKLDLDDLNAKMEKGPKEKANRFSPVRATKRNKALSLEERNLYRAMGELSFVIAKADNILREEERKAFHEVIAEEFGNNSWIAEDRFKWIENTPTSDVESTYNHVLYLIRQNKRALTQDLVSTFTRVITRVAKVANIHENQHVYIDRFQKDLEKLFHDS